MAEHPLSKLGRLLGGVALMHGRVGHQMLGQMLILGSSEVEVAGASVALTATTGQENAVVQAAIRTLVPALAVNALSRKRERRLNRLANLLAEKERELAQVGPLPEIGLPTLKQELVALESLVQPAPAPSVETQEQLSSLEKENEELKSQLSTLNAELTRLQEELAAVKPKPKPVPVPKPKIPGPIGPKKPGSK